MIIAYYEDSGLGEVFGACVLSILGDTKNLYLITAVLFLGSAIATQFMNNMATAGVLARLGSLLQNQWEQTHRQLFLQLQSEQDALS